MYNMYNMNVCMYVHVFMYEQGDVR